MCGQPLSENQLCRGLLGQERALGIQRFPQHPVQRLHRVGSVDVSVTSGARP